ncbi:helix-turn-helix domain-containing protein [Amycolatopsis sp. lyj-108]|uniref:helix-turn-helix domain-containing protein n=1 Tax=Amycolatopsis sp. lyj-108 TaxID=2789286 RepID=UPI0039798E25
MDSIDPLWSFEDVADCLRVPVKTLYQWKWLGEGPPVRKIGRHLRYDPPPRSVCSWSTGTGGAVPGELLGCPRSRTPG